MASKAFVKDVKRVGRLRDRLERLEFLKQRNTDNPERLAEIEEEVNRRNLELAYRESKVAAELKDNPDWSEAIAGE